MVPDDEESRRKKSRVVIIIISAAIRSNLNALILTIVTTVNSILITFLLLHNQNPESLNQDFQTSKN